MAKLPDNKYSSHQINALSCRCSNADLRTNKQGPSFLENAVMKIEERRGDLANRQQCLREKITAMERSIPALMAFNMWTSGGTCDDPPMCKIRQIMKKISPHPDPVEKLMNNLKKTVEGLNTETGELHDKIIAADIKLEESEMQLESLELENKEYDERLKNLEKELTKKQLTKKKTPSLHSIHSEDLSCLARIRELGEEEMILKNSIRELEDRETIFQEQINRILTSKEFQKSMSSDRSTERKIGEVKQKTIPKGKDAEKAVPKKPEAKSAGSCGAKTVEIMESAKKIATQREKVGKERCAKTALSTMPGICYDNTSCPATSRPSSKAASSGKAPLHRNVRHGGGVYQKSYPLSMSSPKSSSGLTTKSNVSRGRVCSSCCKNLVNPLKSSSKSSSPSAAIQWKCCKGKACCQFSYGAKKPAGTMCKKCQGWIPSSEIRSSSRNASPCVGKCALERSTAACDCSQYLESPEHRGYQHRKDPRFHSQSDTDEEYSECCDCGCNDTDLSSDSCEF